MLKRQTTLLFACTIAAASLSSVVTTRLILGTPASAQATSLSQFVTVDSAGNLTIKATSVNIKSSTAVKIEGTTVDLEGASTTTVHGGLVKIN